MLVHSRSEQNQFLVFAMISLGNSTVSPMEGQITSANLKFMVYADIGDSTQQRSGECPQRILTEFYFTNMHY